MSPSPRPTTTAGEPAPPRSLRDQNVSFALAKPDEAGAGWLRSAMDKAAAATADRLAGGPVLAISASKLAVLRTVEPGEVVRCVIEEVRYGTTSLTVSVAARTGQPGTAEKVACSDYTYIAVDAEGLPRPVLEPMSKPCDDPAADHDAGDEKWTLPT